MLGKGRLGTWLGVHFKYSLVFLNSKFKLAIVPAYVICTYVQQEYCINLQTHNVNEIHY